MKNILIDKSNKLESSELNTIMVSLVTQSTQKTSEKQKIMEYNIQEAQAVGPMIKYSNSLDCNRFYNHDIIGKIFLN